MSVIYFIFQQTMYFMIPLMIVALGAMFSERSGIINIALEGIMTMGAFTGIDVYKRQVLSLPLCLLLRPPAQLRYLLPEGFRSGH